MSRLYLSQGLDQASKDWNPTSFAPAQYDPSSPSLHHIGLEPFSIGVFMGRVGPAEAYQAQPNFRAAWVEVFSAIHLFNLVQPSWAGPDFSIAYSYFLTFLWQIHIPNVQAGLQCFMLYTTQPNPPHLLIGPNLQPKPSPNFWLAPGPGWPSP